MSQVMYWHRISPSYLKKLKDYTDDELYKFFDELEDSYDLPRFDVGAYWHQLHLVLTGEVDESDSPMNNAVLGGTPLGDDVSIGDGSPSYLDPDEVQDISMMLNDFDEDALNDSFKSLSGSRHKNFGWGEDELDALISYFRDLVRFYEETALDGDAVIRCVREPV